MDFLTNPARPGLRVCAAAILALTLAACQELYITETPQPAQPHTLPRVERHQTPAESAPSQETAPGQPEIAAPAGPISDIMRKPDQITVAMLLPMTGSASAFGRDLRAAAQMAVFDLADANFELRFYDTGSQPDQAGTAALDARRDGAQIVLGPVFSESVGAAAAVTRPANLPLIAFSNNRDIVGNGVYAMGFFPEDQVRRVVNFGYRRGMTRFAALAPEGAYGNRMVAALNETVAGGGGEVSDVAYFQDETQALTETVKQLGRYDERHRALVAQRRELAARNDEISRRALQRLDGLQTLGEVDFEALLLPASAEQALRIAPLLAFYDIDPDQVKLMGTWVWDDPALRTEPSLSGAWFAAPAAATRKTFIARFEKLYEHTPDRRATLAYDATALAIILAQRAARTNSATVNPFDFAALTAPSGFTGMDGIFRLRPSGLVERGLAVFEIQRDGAHEIDPAPTSFTDIIN